MQEKRLANCGLCGDRCFVELTVEDGKILRTQKAPDDGALHGSLCLRGAALKQYIHHPDRLTQPLRRVGERGEGHFAPISWDEAFALIGERLAKTKQDFGARATVFYSGHPKWYRYLLAELAGDYGSPNYCTESSTCHTAPWMAYKLCYGSDALPPDFKKCKTLLCWGTNPAYSAFSKVNAVLDVAERGDCLLVVDPRKTPVSERATLHLRPRQGTDGALALALANALIARGAEDRDFLARYAEGYEQYRAYVQDFTPHRAEEITGVPAQEIEAAAALIAEHLPLSICTSASGMAHSPNAVQNYRAVFLLEALTGCFDRAGGNHGPAGPHAKLNGFCHDARPREHVEEEFNCNRFPVWNALIPNEGQVMRLERVVETQQPYPIKNIIAFGLNHRMFPQPGHMLRALKDVEFFVDVDLFMTDAARCADLVLPCQAAPEREYVHVLPGGELRYIPKAISVGDTRNDVEIILGISHALKLEGALTKLPDFDAYLDWMLQSAGVTLQELKAAGGRIQAKKLTPGRLCNFEVGLDTPSGKVEFTSTLMKKYAALPGYDELPVYREYMGLNPDARKYPMLLCVGAKKPQFFHSRTYRLPWLAGLEGHTLAGLHPEDAEKLGIAAGDTVRVSSPVCARSFKAELDPGLRPGCVYLIHDDEGLQDANELISEDYFDPVSGFPGFKTYFCAVAKEGKT